MKKSRIPTIIGIILLTLGLAAGIILVQSRQFFRLGASAENAPKDVRISNVTDTSFTVSWITDKETAGFIAVGESESSLSKTQQDDAGGKSFTHSATVRSLKPSTVYFFKINSAGYDFDNNGVLWQAATGPSLGEPAKTILISGTVLTPTGTPSKNAIVYVSVSGSLLSALTSQNGSWILPLSTARSQDLSQRIIINEASTLLEISVQAGPDGVATASVFPQSAKPTPNIILGQPHDFRNLPPSSISDTPRASLGVPQETTQTSGFDVPDEIATPSSQTVTLQSISEGEVITTTEPEFFGEAPPQTTITITVESDPQTTQIAVPSSGNWSWTPPQGLSEGIHKITIVWKDSAGITRMLTRTFVVQAAEGPAFESTPSATPTASPMPTPSPTATASATPTSTASATPKPTSTPSGDLESGSLTPTIVLSIMGISVLAASYVVWRKSDG